MEEVQDTGEPLVEAAAQPANDEVMEQAAPEEEHVPLSALQAERKQRQELQQNMKMMQEHMELMKANQQPQKQPDPYDNLQDDDVLTVGEAKKFMSQIQKNYSQSVEELKMQQAYPDYAETVKKYLPDVIKENPELRNDIENAQNPYKLAYFLAKKSDQYREQNRETKKSQKAERIMENSQKAGSLSSVGQTATANSSRPWNQMSNEEFMQHVNKNLGYL